MPKGGIMKTLATVLILILLSGTAFSAGKDISTAPRFPLQGSIGNNSALTMTCYGEAPYDEIDCSFIQISVRANSPEQTAKIMKETTDEIDKIPQNEFMKEIKSLKKNMTELDTQKMREKINKATNEQAGYLGDSLKVLTAMANIKDKATFKEVSLGFNSLEAATCSISHQTFDHRFKRVNKNKWLYNPGQEGLCNVVRVATIESVPESPELWIFTETIASADKEDICGKWVTVGDTYISRWDAPNTLKFDQCKYLKFVFL